MGVIQEGRPEDLTATPSSGATGEQPTPDKQAATTPTPPSTPSKPTTPTKPAPAPSTPTTPSPTPKSAEQEGDFVVSGNAGGAFQLDAPARTFGASGTVRLNGKQLVTREWGAQRIVGDLPADVKAGEITVDVGGGTVRRAQFKG